MMVGSTNNDAISVCRVGYRQEDVSKGRVPACAAETGRVLRVCEVNGSEETKQKQ